MATITEVLRRVDTSLATEERNRLPQDDFSRFFQALVQVYEQKAENYFKMCSFGAKKEGVAEEKVMEYAYAVFFERNEAVLLVSLRQHLKRHDETLLSHLGLSGDMAKSVFKSYTARLRLFRELGIEQLRLVNIEISQNAPEVYPRYLMEAFEIQRICGDKQILHQYVQQCSGFLGASLQGQLSYIQTLLPDSKIKDKASFVQLISLGYLQQLTEETNRQVLEDHANVLKSNIAQVCLSAMRFFGISCMQPLDFAEAKTKLEQAKQDLAVKAAELKAEAKRDIQAKKAEIISQIDTQVKNVPQHWTIGFNTGVGTGSGAIKF